MFFIHLVYLRPSQKMIARCILPDFHLRNALQFLYFVSVPPQPKDKNFIKFDKKNIIDKQLYVRQTIRDYNSLCADQRHISIEGHISLWLSFLV